MFDPNQPDPSAKIAELESRIAALELGPTDIQVQNKSFTANEGQHCIVECPPAGITATLPRARAQNRNARITFTLRNSNPVRFIAVNGKVNNRTSGVMASPGTFDAISDGSTGWGISVLAAGPSAVPTLNADFVVGVANPGLPNARVATASAEITPSIAVANAISWALNAGSVVLSRLQNLTGLSVLGRAANSAGVMAAITAGGAAQYLRSNSGGTSLEFGDPASASIVNTAGTFVTAAVTGAVTIAQNGTVAAFGTLAAKSVLANATNATAVPAALAGSASFQHLRVNAANSALEWSLLTAGDFPANIVPIGALPQIATDTFLGNVSGGTTGPTAVALSSLAGAGLVFGAHTLDVTAGAGASLVVSANDVQRGALTGAITAAQDSNATAFGSFAAKSVLANATNAGAVPAAFAGTVANTYLRVNSANTALEYGALPASTAFPDGGTTQTDGTGGTINNLTINAGVTELNITANGTYTGFARSGGNLLGDRLIIRCSSGVVATLSSNTGSSAANQIACHDNQAIIIPGRGCLELRWNADWKPISTVRPGVEINSTGAITTAETFNFSDSSSIAQSLSVTAGVATVQQDTVKATQLQLDVGTVIGPVLGATLLGFRPGLTTSSNTGAVNSTAVQVGPQYTVPANTMVVGSCYLLIGYASFVRSVTVTPITLVTSLTVPAAVPVTAGIVASVTASVNRGALVFAFVHCETSGAGGSARANLGVIGQWGAAGATALDFTANTIAVSINTTIANALSLGVACSVAVPGAGIIWQNSAVLRIK